MNGKKKVSIARVPTGVPGLDAVLGGALPEYSLNLIAGGPGTGKTTLAHQIVFGTSSPERRAIYFSVLGEPPLKMLRYQQQFSFFDGDKIPEVVRFINLDEEALQSGLDAVLESVAREVESFRPGIVVIDSIRTLLLRPELVHMREQAFVQRLAATLTSAQVTTLLIGEFSESEVATSSLFLVADAIVWLSQQIERNAIVRKLQVIKIRGQSPMVGLQTFRISVDGIEAFPRMPAPPLSGVASSPAARLPSGLPVLDRMLHGGFLTGDSILVAGPAGTGKTMLSTHFVAAGVASGERAVILVFEEQPDRYLERAHTTGIDLRKMAADGHIEILYLRPVDLSVDETLHAMISLVRRTHARRLVIDSLSGFELAVTPSFREDFRESLYRTMATLSATGVTVMMTVEVLQSFTDLRFSPYEISFVADTLILQRYVEMEGQLRRVMAILKMRGSAHDTHLRLYEVTDQGIRIGGSLEEYRGILTGIPGRVARKKRGR